jgi:hypothetical protein
LVIARPSDAPAKDVAAGTPPEPAQGVVAPTAGSADLNAVASRARVQVTAAFRTQSETVLVSGTVRDKADNALYGQADWMMGNLKFIRVDSDFPTANIKELYTLNPKAVNSPAADFFFDASPVRAELSSVMTEMAANMVPLYIGVLDWDKNYPPALDKMKKAGLDKVVAEYKRQFAAHRATR